MELNTARIFVNELSVAKRFYRDTLELALQADGTQSGYCVFKSANTELLVESVPEDASEEDR